MIPIQVATYKQFNYKDCKPFLGQDKRIERKAVCLPLCCLGTPYSHERSPLP